MKHIKVGDLVSIKESEIKKGLGEAHEFMPNIPYRVDRMSEAVVLELSGINCYLGFNRFEPYVPKESKEPVVLSNFPIF